FVRTLNGQGLASMGIVSLRAIVTAVSMLIFLLIFDRRYLQIKIRDIWCFFGTGILSIIFFNYTAIIVPEIGFNLQSVIDKILETQKNGRNHFIIVVSEGLCDATQLARQLQESTGIETRATILGHIQRGGNPTLRDRVVASKMGYAAVELLSKGVGNRVVGLKDNIIVDYDIFEALNMVKAFDQETYSLAKIISI
ncbi:MAG: 6-phosphofructokinase, partial [Clostridia bacterium]|nr:6-phosphofructokinase [Clostridia bacterium]